ncbi:cytochrome P450 2C15 [Folsomia candida]|uniref:cytochrome P450 2C15 n=1 Tax=Folsomia candida TaxID=158441 RepID=UPI001604C5BF|nr:cytochrome P450 2C15 [Folsomia candida]
MYFEILLTLFVVILFLLEKFKNRSWKKRGPLPPGPYCLPVFGYLPFLGKIPSITIANLAKRYGSVISLRLGQTRVVFVNDFESTKEAGKMDVLQGRHQMALFEPRGYAGLGLLEGKDWKEMRRFTLRCLRDMGFGKRSMEGMMQEQVQEICSFLRKNLGKPLYLKPILELAVVNSTWTLMTSEKFDIEDPAKRDLMQILSDAVSDQNIVGVGAFLPWLAKLAPDLTGYTTGLKLLAAPEQLARDVISSHVATHSQGQERDFIDMALTKIYTTTDPKSVFYGDFGLRNLHYTLLDLFFASSDTISSTLGWAFTYLACYPKVQAKIQMEIDQCVGRSRMPCIEDRSRMPYVEATMQEVLRKSSMVPLGLMHTALEDTHFKGYFIPKRTVFIFNLYQIHHEKKYWGDPDNFRPERFLCEDGTFRRDDHVIPFLVGKRSCPGESLAMNEFFLFLTGILQNFNFELQPGQSPPYLGPRSGFVLSPPKHELLVSER